MRKTIIKAIILLQYMLDTNNPNMLTEKDLQKETSYTLSHHLISLLKRIKIK